MFDPSNRRRARPSKKSIGLSVTVASATIYLATGFFLSDVYIPILVALAVSTAVFWFRSSRLRRALPPPYGQGRTTTIDAKAATRSGILLTVGGGALTIGLMASVFFLPPEVFFAILFGVTAGLPLSEVFYFALVASYERKSRAKVFFVNQETGLQGESVLMKAVEMSED